MSSFFRSWNMSFRAMSSAGSQMSLQRTTMPRNSVSVRVIQLSLSGPDFSSTVRRSSTLAAENRSPLCSPSWKSVTVHSVKSTADSFAAFRYARSMGSVAGSGFGPKAFVSSVRKKPPSCCCIRAFFFVWAGFATNRNSATPGNAKAQTKMGSCCINIEIHPAITSKTPSDMLMLSVL